MPDFQPPAQVGERLAQYPDLVTVRITDLPRWLAEHGQRIRPRRPGQPNIIWPWPYTQTPILLIEPIESGIDS